MKKKGWTAFLRQKQYAIAGALVVIAVIGTTVLYSSRQAEERERLEAELAVEMSEEAEQNLAAAQETEQDTEQTAQASSVIPPKETGATQPAEPAPAVDLTGEADIAVEPEQVAEAVETREVTATRDTLHFSAEDGLLWPMEGNVILNYSMDSTVYFATLDQYKYNPAILIDGDVNNKVYAVAKGQVKSILNDEVTGCTMTVDLGDGYEAVYGQLKELNFEEGDYVESGHVLGYVSEPTKYFSVEGSNLYFELRKDGMSIDPIIYFE